MRIKHIISIILVCFIALSCGSSKRKYRENARKTVVIDRKNTETNIPAATSPSTEKKVTSASYSSVEGYLAAFSRIAQEEMRTYKIPASITLAQAVLESGAGKGALTLKANNHFGIKCHDWTGDVVYHDDDARGECFRKYNDPKFSFRDHSLFLTGRQRYASLFNLKPDDYEGWAQGLRKAGYATDRKYPEKLISIIERYRLYIYDSEVLGNNPGKFAERSKNVVNIHTVQKGDTLYAIAKRYNLTVEELKSKNRLSGNTIEIGQELNVTPEYNGF
ncbi:glucosaminidase domain-containing protein [Flavimarina sp. Hel_I_48]|uniref:glucosaminidase domain-containing protein n=1 Tax=Flavimarina sp. Hel_I_48 TaxID=1392488 RepID=UPI0004DF45B1|nr:glucosaminidase domain-containing protein [Flavimarina sp. Hel_I_48]